MGRSSKRRRARSRKPETALAAEPKQHSTASEWAARLALAVGAPLLVLALVETGLRIAGVGEPTSFFRDSGDGLTVVTRARFGRGFFPEAQLREPLPARVPVAKGESTFRVVVLGGSAARGTPEPAFSFSRMLEVMLAEEVPALHFEVVNLALTAVNSHVLADIAGQCARIHPDVVVVFAGNNEVIGPFGPAGPGSSLAAYPRLLRLSVVVSRLRLGQLLTRAWTDLHDGERSWRGMEMFADRRVAADSAALVHVYAALADNLGAVVKAGRGAGAAVLLCTVPTNLRDCPPFASQHDATAWSDPSTRQAWEEQVRLGTAAADAGDDAAAARYFAAALRLDDAFAELHFRDARSLWRLGRFDEARAHFLRARDLDALRFRADSRTNRVIRELGQRTGTLVDVERAVADAPEVPHGTPGHEVFLEHVHLNPVGNDLVARALLPRIEALLSAAGGDSRRAVPSPAEVEARIGLGPWAAARIATAIADMTARPPFTAQLDHLREQRRRVQAAVEQRRALTTLPDGGGATLEAAAAQHPSDAIMATLHADFLEDRGRLAEAEKAWRGLLAAWPDRESWRIRLGVVLARQGRNAEAVEELRRAAAAMPEVADARFNLAVGLLADGETDEAATELAKVLRLDPDHVPARFQLARLALERGDASAAEAALEEILDLDLLYAPAQGQLGDLLLRRDRVEAATPHLREAVALDPGDALARRDLAIVLMRTGAIAEAMQHLQALVEALPGQAWAVQRLAWLLATDPDAANRDGARAVRLLSSLDEAVRESDPTVLDALAAAYAEEGEFDLAVDTAQRAAARATAGGNLSLARAISGRARLYLEHRPYRRTGS